MRGRRGWWLATGVTIALLTGGTSAGALPDVGPSPILSNEQFDKIFPELADAQPSPYTFEVPDTPECAGLAKAIAPLDAAATSSGSQWATPDASVSLEERVAELEATTAAKSFAKKAKAKDFLSCSQANIDAIDPTAKVVELAQLEGPGHLLGDANVFFASGAAVKNPDGSDQSFVTAWINYDKFVLRLAYRLPGTDTFVKQGRLTSAGADQANMLFGAATNVLWQVSEGRPATDTENAALDTLGANANFTDQIQPTPPSADNPACKDLAKAETRAFPDQYTQFWRTERGSVVDVARGFDTPKQARAYFKDLDHAGFTACQKSLYTFGSDENIKFTFKPQQIRYAPDLMGEYRDQHLGYIGIGGQLATAISGSGARMRTWNLAGAWQQGSTVRLYFISSSAPTTWDEFEKAAAAMVEGDLEADSG